MSIVEYCGHYGKIEFTNDDISVFNSARNGDLNAYCILYERHIDSILSKFIRDTRMNYPDLRQDVYVRTSSNVRKINNIIAWRSYCYKTAKGLLKNAGKKSKPILYSRP